MKTNPDDRGLTKREHFAVVAMQALISKLVDSNNPEWMQDVVSEVAVKQADSLIAALNAGESESVQTSFNSDRD